MLRGGTIVDGTGAPPRRADVRVRAGRIVEIGARLRPDGEAILDCGGATIAPGFIDNHTHFDPSLFWDPTCDPMALHGVTTVLIGNCSLSLAPLPAECRTSMVEVFGFVEDIPLAAFEQGVPWAWETYDEYVRELRTRRFAVNIAQLVGHSPLRMSVMGSSAWDRAATPAELTRMAATADGCMRAGAFGLSTSFYDTDADGNPVPSVLADDDELGVLCDVLAAHSALLEFIPDYNARDPMVDVDRVAAACGPRGVVSTLNGVFHWQADPDRGWRIIDRCSELRSQGTVMLPQISPRTLDFGVNWDESLLFMRLAETWQRAIRARGEEKLAMLGDPAWRLAARREWEDKLPASSPLSSADRLRIVEVGSEASECWVGRTVADLIGEQPVHLSDALAQLLVDNDLHVGVVAVGVANADPAAVAAMLRHPTTIVGNSDAGAHLQMMCAAGDSTLLLTRHVRDRGDLTLEAAVHALTGRQAEIIGLRDRGTIAPGSAADLVVFGIDELVWGPDEFADDLPGGGRRLRRPSGGFRYTIVGGEIVQEDGAPTAALQGTFLLRS